MSLLIRLKEYITLKSSKGVGSSFEYIIKYYVRNVLKYIYNRDIELIYQQFNTVWPLLV
jgi:hypothetical protein